MKVKLFAQIREVTGTESLEMAVPDDATIEGVRQGVRHSLIVFCFSSFQFLFDRKSSNLGAECVI